MPDRRTHLLDAAVELLGTRGARGLTHRAVDEVARCPLGSTSNHFRTRAALLDGVVGRFVERQQAGWDSVAEAIRPRSAGDLAVVLADLAHRAVGPDRHVTMARHVLLVEGALDPHLSARLASEGSRLRAWFEQVLRSVGSSDPALHTPIVQNVWTGIVLHQLANNRPAFDPLPQLAALLAALVPEET